MTAKFKTPAHSVSEFRQRHKLDQPEMDHLFGFQSGGRATRRWEAEDAPFYVAILMAYADAHGIDLMWQMVGPMPTKQANAKANGTAEAIAA